MFFIYGDVALTLGISGGDAAFLTDSSALNDFHSGLVCSMSWDTGSQTTSSSVDLTFTTSTNHIGGVGLVNVQGLPEGLLTELIINGVTFGQQRLRRAANGELGAWYLPQDATNTAFRIRLINDVGGSVAVTAGQEFGAGEIIAGHAIYLKTMIKRSPSAALNDPTAFTTPDAGSVFASLRKPARLINATLGTFTTADVNSSFYSSIDDGKGGKISLRRLQEIFSAAQGMAICDIPDAGQGAGSQHGALRYDQEFMQENFLLARIQNQGGSITMDQPPRYSWQTNWRQSI